MRLGHIDYLNCYPFYYYAFEKKPLEGIKVVSDYPSRLNTMMAEKALDMSPISAATCADLSDNLIVLPDFCLSSIGYVLSVILASKVPIEDLEGKRVGITSASHTSVILLKILLKSYYNVTPEYVPTNPRPSLKDIDAALIIGNDAMVRTEEPASYIYDLGDLWLRKTGFPVVFAVFAVRKCVARKYEKEIKSVVSSYQASLQCLKIDKNELIEKAKKRYPDIIYDIDSYYDLLKFEFTDEMKKALMFYFSAGSDLGLIKKVEKLQYLNFDV